jgi:hypothetical protein
MNTRAFSRFHRGGKQAPCVPISLLQRISLFAVIASCVVAFPAICAAAPITFGPGDYDNTPNTVTNPGAVQHLNQTTGLFRDVFWWSARNSAVGVGSPDYINRGNSLILTGGSPQHAIPGPGPYTALNFTGNSPSGGQSYMAVYDTTPGNVAPQNLFNASAPGGLTVSADVMFAHPGHSVSGGVVALFNEGQDALAFVAHQGGGNNSDHARVELIFQSVGVGTELASINLPGLTTFTNLEWYRVSLNVSVVGDAWTLNGTIQRHVTPTDPTSALVVAPIVAVPLAGSLSSPGNAFDLTNPGEIGVIAQANQTFSDGIPDPLNPTVDNVGVSITNFDVVPEPAALFLLAFGALAVRPALRLNT